MHDFRLWEETKQPREKPAEMNLISMRATLHNKYCLCSYILLSQVIVYDHSSSVIKWDLNGVPGNAGRELQSKPME